MPKVGAPWWAPPRTELPATCKTSSVRGEEVTGPPLSPADVGVGRRQDCASIGQQKFVYLRTHFLQPQVQNLTHPFATNEPKSRP